MSSSSSGSSSSRSGSRRGSGRGSAVAKRLVEGVIADFERRTALPLSRDARNRVIQPAVEHGQHISQELGSGKVTPERIRDAVQTLLGNAEKIARERHEDKIGGQTVGIAMRLECRYFPWC